MLLYEGRSYSKHRCHVCRKKRVYGVVWRCLHCPEYYLCSVCYLANHHCSLHRFTCLLDRDGMQYVFQGPIFNCSQAYVCGYPSANMVILGDNYAACYLLTCV